MGNGDKIFPDVVYNGFITVNKFLIICVFMLVHCE